MRTKTISLLAVVWLLAASPSFLTAQTDDQESNYFEIKNARLQLIDNVLVASRDPGLVEQMDLREGSKVSANDQIARLDSEMYQAEFQSAKDELEIATQQSKNDVDLRYALKSQEVSQQVLNRSLSAVRDYARSISKTEIDRLRLELKRAELSKEQAEQSQIVNDLTANLKRSQLDVAKLRLRNRSIKSPINGTVIEVFKRKGEWVGTGEPIARIVGIDRLKIVCATKANKFDPSTVSDQATFVTKVNGKEISVPAIVTFISPELTIGQDIKILAEVDNSNQQLRSGQAGVLKLQVKNPEEEK